MVQVLWQLSSWVAKARVVPTLALLAGTLGAACSVAPVEDGADADVATTTHALITVERSSTANSTDAPSAAAFAGFVRTPPNVDANAMLRLAGFGLDLPAVGLCGEPSHDRLRKVPLSGLGQVEFLDAGDVSLRTSTTSALLATRALPAVTDLIAGVVYTTRDRAAEPLPAAVNYTLSTSGGVLRAFNVDASAPPVLRDVTIANTAFAELTTVSPRNQLSLSWAPGQSGDWVYVELTTHDGSATTRCTFRDDAGVGSVPASAFAGSGAGEVSLHRVHSEPFSSGSVDAGEVRFDFEQSANVEFTD